MHPANPNRAGVTGVILAGGRANRMGGLDKGLLPLAGRPLVEWVIEALTPQVSELMISANRNLEEYGRHGLPLIKGQEPGFAGPLAGILSALTFARTEWILTVPCDAPRLPADLLERLALALDGTSHRLAVATDGNRLQPLHALIPVTLAASLRQFLDAGDRKVEHWLTRESPAIADFSDVPAAFVNLNTPDDAQRLEQALFRMAGDAR